MVDEQLVGTLIERTKTMFGEYGMYPSIRREVMKEYSMETSIAFMTELGKMRNPKFVIDEYNRTAYENVIRWLHSDSAMMCMDPASHTLVRGNIKAGLFISGNTGSGKSWLLDFALEYARIYEFRIMLGKRISPLSWRNIRTDRICDEYSDGNSITGYKDADIIGFQDLGSEPVEALNMGTRLEVMRSILESRSDDDKLVTLITSNMRPGTDAFVKRYGDRVNSRMASMCNYIELTGPDRRKMR